MTENHINWTRARASELDRSGLSPGSGALLRRLHPAEPGVPTVGIRDSQCPALGQRSAGQALAKSWQLLGVIHPTVTSSEVWTEAQTQASVGMLVLRVPVV